jgi:hypothetical protein
VVDPLVGPRRFADHALDQTLVAVSGFTDRIALTRELEEVAFRGWSALRTELVDGWVLRDSDGATRRGNSVWPHDDVADLAAALALVDRFYARAGRPAFVQLTPASRPTELHEALDAAGYEPEQGPTDVCVADLAGIVARVAGRAERGAPAGGPARVPVGCRFSRGTGPRASPCSPGSRRPRSTSRRRSTGCRSGRAGASSTGSGSGSTAWRRCRRPVVRERRRR